MSVELVVVGFQAFSHHSSRGTLVRKGQRTMPQALATVVREPTGTLQCNGSPTTFAMPKTTMALPVEKHKPRSPNYRKKNKYRLKSHSPSYCDESLFGPLLEPPSWEAPWSKKEDTFKVRPLLWYPPTLASCSEEASPTAHTRGTNKRNSHFSQRLESAEDNRPSTAGLNGYTERKWRPASAAGGLESTRSNVLPGSASMSEDNRRPRTVSSVNVKPRWRY
ncbi:RBPJ-interacting and tubulin-associated protein 1-like [Erpetoichthys calabaricus]|uniref:RBPJ-interacting and tubulin-associated protein 1-like n=1 Tax=Erpetoichthys calabaricus TaxID=27687 RepID=UPI00109EE3F0|nr:RBPJ-interacting and tubulin-associated protein 1-like [Erpetoichthys calabaricus]XP_028680061.1 RBPJ-interacting and tubulin-associated protein 1-like [Erpetoichthys calabaricus]XP_028680062.1 RBPJ-interacting and tubulin-associated protein 1-like [Erpetoichthys calabaricus]